MAQVHGLIPLGNQEVIGADVNIDVNVHHTQITAFNLSISIPNGADYGQIKTIENDSGSAVTLTSVPNFVGGGASISITIGTTVHLTWIDNDADTGWQVKADPAQPDHEDLTNIGTNTHAQIDTHLASTANPHSVTKSQVGLGDVENLKVNLVAVVDPTVNDDVDLGYVVGSRWFNVTADREFVCLDNTDGAAIWHQTSILPVGASITDNALVKWDTSTGKLIQNSVGILTDAGELSGLTELDIIHTATADDDHAIDIEMNAAGFANVRAVNLAYNSGALAAGDNGASILTNINEFGSAASSRVFGHAILTTTEGSANVHGIGIGAGVNPIFQQSGTFGDTSGTLLNIAVDVTTALSGGGAGNITAFVANSDTFTVGHTAQYTEMEFIIDIASSNGGIMPTFEFSTAAGPTYTAFSPTDGTNGFRNSGVITWVISDLPATWVAVGGEFLIRITRNRVTVATPPRLDLVQITVTNEYSWDNLGDVSIKSLILNGVTSGAVTIDTQAAAGTWALTLPTDGGTVDYLLRTDGSGNTTWVPPGAGSGDVVGPGATVADNSLAIYDGTGGLTIKESVITDVSGDLTGLVGLEVSGSNNTLIRSTLAADPSIILDSNNASGGIEIQQQGVDRIKTNATGLGFFNSSPIAKPTITGERNANPALADFLTDMASLGLITDSTTLGSSGGSIALPTGYIQGLLISDDTVATKDISAGSCRSDDDTTDIVSAGVLTPNVSTSGPIVNGRDTAAAELADNWYYIYVIADSNEVNPVASLLSSSSTSPVFPTGYDKKRLIGAVRNDTSSDFYDYFSNSTGRDRTFHWKEVETILEILTNGAATTWANIDLSEFVPAISTMVYINTNHVAGGAQGFVEFRPDGSSIDPSAWRTYAGEVGATTVTANSTFWIETSVSQVIEYQNSSVSEETDVWVLAFTINL